MTYQKPQVEIVRFDFAGFMTTSLTYSSAGDMLSQMLGDSYSGNTNNFNCSSFGTPVSGNGQTYVTVNGYTFEWHGNNKNGHWKYCSEFTV